MALMLIRPRMTEHPYQFLSLIASKGATCFPLPKTRFAGCVSRDNPDVVKFRDAVEADGTVYIMTEHVKPLSAELTLMGG